MVLINTIKERSVWLQDIKRKLHHVFVLWYVCLRHISGFCFYFLFCHEGTFTLQVKCITPNIIKFMVNKMNFYIFTSAHTVVLYRRRSQGKTKTRKHFSA